MLHSLSDIVCMLTYDQLQRASLIGWNAVTWRVAEGQGQVVVTMDVFRSIFAHKSFVSLSRSVYSATVTGVR